MGIHQLIGNAWEWCQEAIYPYDGFVIDPVYREMSYPFFGYKKRFVKVVPFVSLIS